MQKISYKIGVDIGGTHIGAAIIKNGSQIIGRKQFPFPQDEVFATDYMSERGSIVCDYIYNLVTALLHEQRMSIKIISGIGIAVPGGISKDNETVIKAGNLGFYNLPLRKLVARRFENTRVSMINDADAAMLAEYTYGELQDTQTAVLITLGTGVGGGLVIAGKPFKGGMGNGIELGHMILKKDGDKCGCGHSGCVETLCSATAIKNMAIRSGYKKADDKFHARNIIDDAKDGIVDAEKIFDEFVDNLSCAIVTIINFIDPEKIVIGGGIAHTGD